MANASQDPLKNVEESSMSSKTKSATMDQAGSNEVLGFKLQSSTGNALGSFCSIKLNHENYLLWKSMILPVIRGNRLEFLINGTRQCPQELITSGDETVQNPEYNIWVAHDQNLLSWLYNSLDLEVASEVMGNETSRDLWRSLETLFGVQTRSNVVFFKKEFRRMQKGGMKMEDYLKTMKKLADNLALAGQPVDSDDLVSQVLAGLDSLEYNPIVCQINEKENVSWMEVQFKLISYEKRLEQITNGINNLSIHQSTANFAYSTNRSRGTYQNRASTNYQPQHQSNYGQNQNRYHGNYNNFRGGNGRFRGRGGRPGSNSRPICQVCGRMGHSAAYYNYRFDNSYMGSTPNQPKVSNQQTALVASPEIITDPAWYVDSGASSHITGEPNNLSQKSSYHGMDNGNYGGTQSCYQD